ncbi:TetR/AcrR family transcriptional regulator [Myceligenerans salitolerans]|uniref:WHG domain-containing protein n=1 Tax=Myceligenerans salitolerans TaxID=1230528 RepID=A0ABS3IBG0_9MICO|nr:TetR-like C-terminal domain-containing protein [Myceligenerans salitolerans]MBO0610283.1 WHG domain-containing protein [Myceligenerans salitolerans]
MNYHHGDLRRAMIAAAATAVAERGPAGLSLRGLARLAGVSHAAPAHHFGDKAGVLTALAAEGFTLLATALDEARGDLLASGVAYVTFAVDHPGHFAVMFDRSLVHREDPGLLAAERKASAALADLTPDAEAARAAWSVAHGFAALWLSGAISGPDVAGAAEPVLRRAVAGRSELSG